MIEDTLHLQEHSIQAVNAKQADTYLPLHIDDEIIGRLSVTSDAG